MRLNYTKLASETYRALGNVSATFADSSIDPLLRYLVELRVSQINGCAFCVDKHSQEAREVGETQQRLDCLVVWREAPFYTDRERAAFEWAETVTLLSETHVPDEAFDAVRKHFSDKEVADLTMIIAVMNAWNRLAVTFRTDPPKR